MGYQHPLVLVVNDDEDMSETLREILQDRYSVVLAHDGREALQKLRDGVRPCIILLDLMMPVMSGIEFRREQLRDAELAAIPAIVLSAVNDVRERAAELAAAAYVQLPRDVEHIAELLERHCLK
jgi:two-component system response regulator MprA